MMQAFIGEMWPDELGSRWRDACLDAQQQMHAVAKKVLQGLALALDRDVHFFDQARALCPRSLQCLPAQ